MTRQAEQLLREALALTADERASVAAELLASLDDDEPAEDPREVEAAWAAEIEARALRAAAGDSVSEPWEVVRDRIARELAQR
jgi:hypothetical protein